ncbi:MAG TPA: hypothetical protein VII99_02800 [Bacteroidia bacterium]
MKKILLLIQAFLMVTVAASAGNIILEGNYQGKNLYVQNPFAGTGVGFCVQKVEVNGQVTTDEINSSAFEIDFNNYQFKIGDKITVKITHKDDCKPKVLNPEVLKPKSTFEVITMKLENDGTLKWNTKNETGKLPFVIEQYRWNKWVKVGEMDGKGIGDNNDYTFKITTLHSGENQIRIKQIDYTSQPRYSKPVKFVSTIPEITFSPQRVSKDISFSAETLYEIYDQFGNVVKKGFGKTVDCGNLAKGVYYLNFDNKTSEFIKK